MSKMGSRKPMMDRNSWRMVKPDIAKPVKTIKGRKKTKNKFSLQRDTWVYSRP